MLRVPLFTFLITAGTLAMGQTQDKYIRVYGKVLSQSDSSAISASLNYEKLPYYDDLGTTRSDADQGYEFYLEKGIVYNITLQNDQFIPVEHQITIQDTGDAGMMRNFYLNPLPEEEELELLTLNNLIFSRGSDRITEVSFAGLDSLVQWLDGRPTMVIQLEGHTDFAGNEEANMRLSQARVEAVKEYLVKQGIKKNRVLTKAFGGSQPLFTERTDEAKTKNRRVEVRVISK